MNVDDLVETFESLPDWEERYRALIEMGRALPAMPDALKTPESKVRGCMSQVWMSVKSLDPFDFFVDSDSTLVKGLAAILHLAYAGKPKKEAADKALTETEAKNPIASAKRELRASPMSASFEIQSPARSIARA